MTRESMLEAYDQAAAKPDTEVLVVIVPIPREVLEGPDAIAARDDVVLMAAHGARCAYDELRGLRAQA